MYEIKTTIISNDKYMINHKRIRREHNRCDSAKEKGGN